jgi:hypothetical protein
MLGALPYTTVVLIERISIGFIIASAVTYLIAFRLIKTRPAWVGRIAIAGWVMGAVGFGGVVAVQPDTLNIVLTLLFLVVTANHGHKLWLRAREANEQTQVGDEL